MKGILALCCLCLGLTACSWGSTMDSMERVYDAKGNLMEPNLGSSVGSGFAGGTDLGISGAAEAAASVSVGATAEMEEVASWDLMVKHGQYHATSLGKVYPYGEVAYGEDKASTAKSYHDYYDEARDSVKEAGEDLKTTMEDLW